MLSFIRSALICISVAKTPTHSTFIHHFVLVGLLDLGLLPITFAAQVAAISVALDFAAQIAVVLIFIFILL